MKTRAAVAYEAGKPLVIKNDWLKTRYHTPRDDYDQPIDFDSAAKHAQLYFLIGHEVASGQERPAWNTGDFFGEKFARSAGE